MRFRPLGKLAGPLWLLGLAAGPGCGRIKPADDGMPDAAIDVVDIGGADTGGTGDAGDGSTGGFVLVGAPLIFAPTPHGFGVNAVLRTGEPAQLRARVRPESGTAWTELGVPASPAVDIAQWSIDGLSPGRRYVFELRAGDAVSATPLYTGDAMTAREPGTPFTFALFTDTHIPPRETLPLDVSIGAAGNSFQDDTLLAVADDMAAAKPDFLLNVGDILDYHQFGFNNPPPDSSWSRRGYLGYRQLLRDTLGHAAHFPVLGNWDGESGCNTAEEINRSRSQRMLYLPGPKPDTYPEGGSPNEDYYAFTWGDALFVVLNVMTYTPTCHLLDFDPGRPDDWTLGAAQLSWLDETLANAKSKWRFTFIHHTVGGAAGDYDNSAYGRGGGQAAHVGEQAVIHEMLKRYGVQVFFYAHDHVFTDMLVDGIHYMLPGSAGAPWKFTTSETGYTTYLPDSGYARVDVAADRAQVDFVAMGGQVLSSYVLH